MMDWVWDQVFRIEFYMDAGGPVMYPLVGLSIVLWALIVNRILFFRKLYHRNMTARCAMDHIHRHQVPDPKVYRGAVSWLVRHFLLHRNRDKSLDRFIIDESVMRLERTLSRYLALIGVLAGVAPLLGLLGTVTGMIRTFDALCLFGTGNTRAMANGISEALITTQTGLIVAVPGLYMKHFLEQRAKTLKHRISATGYYLKRRL